MNAYFLWHPFQRRLRAIVLILAMATMASAIPAHARKVALIIGNSAYANTTSLVNPPNDAKIVAESARKAGFSVTLANDLGNGGFQRTLRDFRAQADGSDIAMIYYAGHAIEGQGKNWLIPTDARLETEYDLPYEAINLDRLLEAVSGSRVRMLVLDSCRNNPFGNSWRRGVRAVPAGMAGYEVDDVLVLYAAAPGQVAQDGDTGNSPFALSLAKRLDEPGLALQLLGGAVRDDVLQLTGGKQRPFVSASITGTPIYLVEPKAVAAPSSGADRTTLEALAWQGAASSESLAGYEAFLQQFPQGIFSKMARARIAKLQAAESSTGVDNSASFARTATVAEPAEAPVKTLTPASVQAAVSAPEPKPAPALVPVTPSPSLAAIPPQPVPTAAPAPGASATPAELVASRGNGVEGLKNLAPLPTMPATPRFSDAGYPQCKDDYKPIVTLLEKVDAINRCTTALDQYYSGAMLAFRQRMIEHQNEISKLYSEKVGGKPTYAPESQQAFFKEVRAEHDASNPGGANFADYRTTEARYRADRDFLHERYCEFAGCASDASQAPAVK